MQSPPGVKVTTGHENRSLPHKHPGVPNYPGGPLKSLFGFLAWEFCSKCIKKLKIIQYFWSKTPNRYSMIIIQVLEAGLFPMGYNSRQSQAIKKDCVIS
jgi:hypothetical protein